MAETTDLTLADALTGTYKSKNQSADMMAKDNYVFDKELSNIQSRVYFNQDNNKLLITYRGTKNWLNDIPTDFAILTGNLKETDRYKHSKDVYNKAKAKYNGSELTVAGHSLGGSLASAVGEEGDNIVTYNKGAGLFEPLGKSKSNEKSYSWSGDIISGLSIFNSNRKSLGSLKDPLSAHNLKNLEHIRPIYL